MKSEKHAPFDKVSSLNNQIFDAKMLRYKADRILFDSLALVFAKCAFFIFGFE